MNEFYKIVSKDMKSCHGGSGKWKLGSTRRVRGDLKACKNGLHVCDTQHLSRWLAQDALVLRVTVSTVRIEESDKIVVRTACPTAVLGKLTDEVLRLFAADCAERALLRERAAGRKPHPDSWKAVACARLFATGKVTQEELSAAESAAESAAWSAAESAARSAAESAARSAAWSAAESAARSAAWSRQKRKLQRILDRAVAS